MSSPHNSESRLTLERIVYTRLESFHIFRNLKPLCRLALYGMPVINPIRHNKVIGQSMDSETLFQMRHLSGCLLVSSEGSTFRQQYWLIGVSIWCRIILRDENNTQEKNNLRYLSIYICVYMQCNK